MTMNDHHTYLRLFRKPSEEVRYHGYHVSEYFENDDCSSGSDHGKNSETFSEAGILNLNKNRCYRCELCGIDGMTEQNIQGHISTVHHQNRMNDFERVQARHDFGKAIPYLVRIEQLNCKSWNDAVYAEVLRWMLTCPSMYQQVPIKVKALVEHFEFLEKLSVLELAIWKAACVSQPDENILKSNDYHVWLEWANKGWKRKKKNTRKTSSWIPIIMEKVVPFLHDAKAKKSTLKPILHASTSQDYSDLIKPFLHSDA